MIWGLVRRRVASSQVLGQAWRARPTVSGSCSYDTARKEASLICKEIACVQSSSYHTFLGGHVYPKASREVNTISQTEYFIRMSNRSFSSDNGDVVEAVVPFTGESITDGTLATFLKKPGDRVEVDEPITQIETDKVTIDVVSPEAGVITKPWAHHPLILNQISSLRGAGKNDREGFSTVALSLHRHHPQTLAFNTFGLRGFSTTTVGSAVPREIEAKGKRFGTAKKVISFTLLPNLALFWHINEGMEEILADYVHHEITRNLVVIYLRLFLLILAKDVFVSLV
ncbi:uncharacterized protein LOC21397846 isoform X2 [Morus notabilis]|uniref:uncharacterized protein LOC21397846 isoform X2 n=1 Tax=Morus notabilis TaxID=981085 RepID=UPI000CED2834|nr:uncharacterized protein LOC21397846 isoform X2 [Morus notabilis]